LKKTASCHCCYLYFPYYPL